MANYEAQMEMFDEGGMLDEGGSIDPVSGNDVPSGSTQEEVRDDINAKLSEGEFVLPADVVRYVGLENIMKMRDMAKEGLAKMEAMGQMGNSEEATISDTTDFDDEINQMIDEMDDDVPEFNVGGLAGYQQQQNQQGFAPTTVGFLPPGVTAPTAPTGELPQAPVITPGSGGGIPTYETKQYIGPNGEIRTFTFINGKPFPDIPEGFKEYTPAEVPTTQTGVPTTQVSGRQSDGDGGGPGGGEGDGTSVGSTKVDPTTVLSTTIAKLQPNSPMAGLVKEQEKLNEKMMKKGFLSVLGLGVAGPMGALASLAFNGYKYKEASDEVRQKMEDEFAKLSAAEKNIILDAGLLNPKTYDDAIVANTYSEALKQGASPATAAAVALTSQRAFAEIPAGTDLGSFEQQTADIFRDVTGGSLNVGSAQTAMLSEQDLGLFDSEADRQAFYDMPSSTRTSNFQAGSPTVTAPSADVASMTTSQQRAQQERAAAAAEAAKSGITTDVGVRGFDTFTQGIFDAEAGSRLGPQGQYTDVFGNVSQTGPISAQGFEYDLDKVLADTTAPTISVGGDGGSDYGSQNEQDAVEEHGWGSDEHFDAIDEQFDNLPSTSGGGGGGSDNGGGESGGSAGGGIGGGSLGGSAGDFEGVDFGGGGGGGDSGGGGSYCCTKMVEHGLWSSKKELAMMYKWHYQQPQWWIDGYDVWGHVVAETVLKKNSPFWTRVMQEFYEHHARGKKRTIYSTIGDLTIYPGSFVCGMFRKLTGRHINAIQ